MALVSCKTLPAKHEKVVPCDIFFCVELDLWGFTLKIGYALVLLGT